MQNTFVCNFLFSSIYFRRSINSLLLYKQLNTETITNKKNTVAFTNPILYYKKQ